MCVQYKTCYSLILPLGYNSSKKCYRIKLGPKLSNKTSSPVKKKCPLTVISVWLPVQLDWAWQKRDCYNFLDAVNVMKVQHSTVVVVLVLCPLLPLSVTLSVCQGYLASNSRNWKLQHLHIYQIKFGLCIVVK